MALEACELDKSTVTTDKSLSEGSNQLANRPHCAQILLDTLQVRVHKLKTAAVKRMTKRVHDKMIMPTRLDAGVSV